MLQMRSQNISHKPYSQKKKHNKKTLKHRVTIKQQPGKLQQKNMVRNPNTIIVGKIYATWCGHCVRLEPEWRKVVKTFKGNPNIKFVSIEETNMKQKLQKFYNKYSIKKEEEVTNFMGFPTIFKITNAGITYFEQHRDAASLIEWIKN